MEISGNFNSTASVKDAYLLENLIPEQEIVSILIFPRKSDKLSMYDSSIYSFVAMPGVLSKISCIIPLVRITSISS